jgi:hypothetical protein
MRWQAAVPLWLVLGCGPALPDHGVVSALDGSEIRVLASHEVALPGDQRLLRVDFEARAFDDREASRKEARALLSALGHLARRRHVLLVANGPRRTPWSDEREQLGFLFERSERKWRIVAEEAPALAQARLQ